MVVVERVPVAAGRVVGAGGRAGGQDDGREGGGAVGRPGGQKGEQAGGWARGQSDALRGPAGGRDPQVGPLLRWVTAAEALVLLTVGGGLLLLPEAVRAVWPWTLPPFNAAFLGAVYLAALVSAACVVGFGRWSPARVVVPMILVFTLVVLLVSLGELGRFRADSAATWLWFALYAGIPANAARYVWRSRALAPASGRRLGPRWRVVLLAQTVVLGAYGVALIVIPGPAASFWPWPVDAFHARLYSATVLAPALGGALLLRGAARREVLALGLTQAALGVLSILGLLAVEATLRRVPWGAPGTWVWIGGCAALVITGAALVRTASRLPAGRRAERRTPDGGAERRTGTAGAALRHAPLLIGIAFTVAGVAGFVPALTPPPPAEAPPLVVTAGYGYLLGLFPVNAVHSLFHLGVGVAGLLIWWRHPAGALPFVRAFAVTLGVLTVLGAVPALSTALGLAPLFGHDVWLHAVEGIAAGYAGFAPPFSRRSHE